jgi:hypothetical protein
MVSPISHDRNIISSQSSSPKKSPTDPNQKKQENPYEEDPYGDSPSQSSSLNKSEKIVQKTAKQKPVEIQPFSLSSSETKESIKNKFLEKYKECSAEFERNDYIKLSRRQTKFSATYFIEKSGSMDNVPLQEQIKIYKMVHKEGGVLGRGAMKIAKMMIDIDTGKPIRVKARFYSLTEEEINTQRKEMLKVLQHLRNNPIPHVAPGHYVVFESNKPGKPSRISCIMSDYAEYDLEKITQPSLKERDLWIFQILKGLAGLHKHNIAHRDIKPDNIHIKEGAAYLADFDFAVFAQAIRSQAGAFIYQAPEVLRKEENVDLLIADVYSTGVTLFEFCCEKHPIDMGILPKKRKERANLTEEDYNKRFMPDSHHEMQQLLYEMMHPLPSKRPSAKEAMERFKTYYIKTYEESPD